jgi:hypothetical protein
LDQSQYVKKITASFGMDQSKHEVTPESTSKPSKPAEQSAHLQAPAPVGQAGERRGIFASNYRSAIGALGHLANSTRLDIAHAVNQAARHQEQPTVEDVNAVRRIFRYIHSTPQVGLLYSGGSSPQQGSVVLTAFSDSDWSDDRDQGRSTTGYVLKMSGAAVSWVSQRQPCVALSSTEAEYVAASEACREVMWFRKFLAEVECAQEYPTLLSIDNQTTLRMVFDEGGHSRRKHIDVKHHYIRERAQQQFVSVAWVSTTDQQADILTKPLVRERFKFLRDLAMGQTNMADMCS